MKRAFIFLLIVGITVSSFGRAITIKQAKKRNPEVKKLLKEAEGELAEWVDSLIKYMPTIDLVSLNADSFIADLKALKVVRDSLPWGRKIPDNYFFHYVLPYRVSQEPLEYFRKNHWRELLERVRDCENIKDAVLRLNEWAYEMMKYEPTTRWDQTAEQTIKRGIGRCEEMAILFIKACRTMCIPVRGAYTPYWPFTNSNHAWVEVWTGDKWYFLGGAEMTPLNDTWFAGPSKRAAVIKGVAWGVLDSADAPIYYKGDGFTILNLTPNYSDTTGLWVTVENEDGTPAESIDVWISVYNYSSLRAVSHHYTDGNGMAHFVVGKADLFVSAGKDSVWDYRILRFTEGNNVDTVKLKLERISLPDTMFWLHVRKPVERKRDTTYKPPETSKLKHNLRQEHLRAVCKKVLARLPDSTVEARFLRIMNDARGNRCQLMKFWDAHQNEREEVLKLWESMAKKDLLLLDSLGWETLWSHVNERKKLFEKRGFTEDSLFWDYVANPRVLFEDFADWHDAVWEKFSKLAELPVDECAAKIRTFITKKLDTLYDKDYFGGMMNPAEVLRARTGGRAERLGVAVAAMRVLGIPARISWDYRACEYYDGKDWHRIDIAPKEEQKERETGFVRAIFLEDGKPRTDVDYYENFCIVKVIDGRISDLTPPKDTVDSFVVFKDVPTGDYAIITGWRNGFGAPFVRVKPFSVKVGETTFVRAELGMPPIEMIKPGDLVIHRFKKISDTMIADIHGKPLGSDWKTGRKLLAFFDIEHESSISTMKRLASIQGIPMLLFVATDDAQSAEKFCEQNGLSGRIFVGTDKDLKKVLRYKQLPSILLLEDGEPIMWVEGLNLNVDKLVKTLIK